MSKALQDAGIEEFVVHTGQHYDHLMSQVFFDEMGIAEPNVNLGVGSGNHGWQMGRMLIGVEEWLLAEKPDYVLVYGDTNSTLAGALAAVKLHISVAHVEAGLRSYNREMPEEHNRVLTDHCADLLFCPTQTAVSNLAREGITQGVHHVGDTMYDAAIHFLKVAEQSSDILTELNVLPKQYLLATVHRPYNTDDLENLRSILTAFIDCGESIIFPVHPRTREKMTDLDGLNMENSKIMMIPPVGYLDMLVLEKNARMILTDSGGIQKEAFFFKVPCVTLRAETEWVETVDTGWNVLAGADRVKILTEIQSEKEYKNIVDENIFGEARVAERIVSFFV